ncbi:MAG: serine/threonine-protein kinase [Panacagrimonas sp.]
MIARGTSLSHYRIVRPLGSGGMADVYEAEDEKLGRRVALKVLSPELSRKPEFVKRFEKEVRAAASLNHPGIVTVFEFGQAEGCLFYSMRLLPGGDLADRIGAGLTASESLALVREVAEAFDHAHSHGLVHRDVKPANILFDGRGRAVLTDFGIVKALDGEAHLTAAGVAIGTPRYMSPEQAQGQPVDARTDLYGLGVILYEMLTGRVPYEAPQSISVMFMHMNEPIPRLPAARAGLQPLLDSLMAKNPADRPASAAALIAMVDAMGAAEALAAPPAPQRDIATVVTPIPTQVLSSSFEEATEVMPTVANPWNWRRAVFIGTGLLAALVLALVLAQRFAVNTSTPRVVPAQPEIPAVKQEMPPPAVVTREPPPTPAPEPVMATLEPKIEPAPLSEDAALEPPEVVVPAKEQAAEVPSARPERRTRPRLADARDRSPPQPSDPECDELHILFGLGQTLSPEQQTFLTEKCR